MPVFYELFIRHEFYGALLATSKSHREKIVNFIESLAADSFQTGDYAENDSSGRPCFVKITGKYAIFFWADHATKEVRIVDLVDADWK